MTASAVAAREIQILLVEDNPGDVRLTQEALVDARVPTHLHVVGDGEEAMAFLRRKGSYSSRPRPDLVLLDLNLPKKDGREVLEEIKADSRLARIPVIVLSTSSAEVDVLQSYDLHANCYITKPFDINDFYRVLRTLEEFWLLVARLPTVR